jgi:hypothetical protein
MAKRLAVPSKELELYIVGARDAFKASRVQRLTMNTDIPSTTVDEIGNPSHVGDVKDTPNITVTFSAFDVGIKIFAALIGQDPAAYTSADASTLYEFDAVFYVKDPDVSDYVKSAHAKRLQVRDFTFNYSADGEATEEYTAVGSEKRWFTRDVVVDKFDTGGGGTSTHTLTQTPIVLRNGRYALSVKVAGKYLDEVSGVPDVGQYRVVGTTLTLNDSASGVVIACYQANPAGSNWSEVSDATMPAAIRGKDVGVKISANSIPRVQSVTINGTLNTQQVKEMGNRNIVGYQRQIPEITGTITVLDTDTELMSLLQYGVLSGVATEFAPGEGCVTSGVALEINLYDPCDTEAPITVTKTVYLDDITVTGDSFTSNVNQNAQQTFNFKSRTAHCVVYSGAK